ncbi:MAG: ribosomal L7Ae/L30e/S12e/Gadd45 family protein [Bacillota bacterium]|nr:ribosomal L7Ae/L30e/S12e/Gadd45 family protein [Bacillota bacterium]
MRKKIHSYLGFARKSGKLMTGYNACVSGMERGRVRLLLLAGDLSDSTGESCRRAAKDCNVAVRTWGTKEELSLAVGMDNRGVFGIADAGLARAIREEIDKEVCS